MSELLQSKPRRVGHPYALASAARIVAIIGATFATIGGGIWYASAHCRAPCRLDHAPTRIASVPAVGVAWPWRGRPVSAPEENARNAADRGGTKPVPQDATIQPAPATAPARKPQPATSAQGNVRPGLQPASQSRDDLWKRKFLGSPGRD